MKKQTTKKKPATVKAKTVVRRRSRTTTAPARAKKRTTKKDHILAGVQLPTPPPVAPPPAPVPPPPNGIDQSWRAGIDWVAAGRKAYETRMRNIAARQAGVTQPVVVTRPGGLPDPSKDVSARRGPGVPLVQPAPIAQKPKRKWKASATSFVAGSVEPEGDTQRKRSRR